MQKGCVKESTIWLKMVSFSLLFDTLQGTTHEESIASMLHRIFLYLMHWIIFLSSYTFNSVILNLSDINAWDNQSMHFFFSNLHICRWPLYRKSWEVYV